MKAKNIVLLLFNPYLTEPNSIASISCFKMLAMYEITFLQITNRYHEPLSKFRLETVANRLYGLTERYVRIGIKKNLIYFLYFKFFFIF